MQVILTHNFSATCLILGFTATANLITAMKKTKTLRNQPPSTATAVNDNQISPAKFASVVTRVAVAQICRSAGYFSVRRSALKVLADVAGKYLGALAESAADSANSGGRTCCNLSDVAVALERIGSVHGFPGASDLTRPILSSSILVDLMRFVRLSAEIPFAQPVRRRLLLQKAAEPCPGVTQSSYSHIPRWLPAIPEMKREVKVVRIRERLYGCLDSEKRNAALSEKSVQSDDSSVDLKEANEEMRKDMGVDLLRMFEAVSVDEKMRTKLATKRGRVRFKIGGARGGVDLDVDYGNGVCRGGKRILCDSRTIEEEEDNNIIAKRKRKRSR